MMVNREEKAKSRQGSSRGKSQIGLLIALRALRENTTGVRHIRIHYHSLISQTSSKWAGTEHRVPNGHIF